jgi:hypothetical protein
VNQNPVRVTGMAILALPTANFIHLIVVVLKFNRRSRVQIRSGLSL